LPCRSAPCSLLPWDWEGQFTPSHPFSPNPGLPTPPPTFPHTTTHTLPPTQHSTHTPSVHHTTDRCLRTAFPSRLGARIQLRQPCRRSHQAGCYLPAVGTRRPAYMDHLHFTLAPTTAIHPLFSAVPATHHHHHCHHFFLHLPPPPLPLPCTLPHTTHTYCRTHHTTPTFTFDARTHPTLGGPPLLPSIPTHTHHRPTPHHHTPFPHPREARRERGLPHTPCLQGLSSSWDLPSPLTGGGRVRHHRFPKLCYLSTTMRRSFLPHHRLTQWSSPGMMGCAAAHAVPASHPPAFCLPLTYHTTHTILAHHRTQSHPTGTFAPGGPFRNPRDHFHTHLCPWEGGPTFLPPPPQHCSTLLLLPTPPPHTPHTLGGGFSTWTLPHHTTWNGTHLHHKAHTSTHHGMPGCRMFISFRV